MRKLATLGTLISLTLTTACIPVDSDAIQDALPTSESVRIEVPAPYKSLGETADFYRVTRQLADDLNGGAGWVLLLVHTIVQYPVTTVADNVYTWGPHSDALDPAEWRLVVTENQDGTYDWSLDARSKIEAETEFTAIIHGNAVPGAEPHRGSGTFTIDFDAAERIDPDDNDANGQLSVTYDLGDRAGSPIAIDMRAEVKQSDASGSQEVAEFDYAYGENPDGSGNLRFGIHDNMDDSSALEDMEINSRWQADGQGRADVVASGGDLGDLIVFASECWDDRFRRVYWNDSANWIATEGAEADCVFQDAVHPDGDN